VAGRVGAIAGLWYRAGGAVVKNPARPPIDDLDRLPFPAWDLMPYKSYEGDLLMRNTTPFVTMQTSRGCPYSCTYCPYPVTQGRKLRVRTPVSVVDEIQWLVDELGVKAILFRDPEFAMKRERVLGICDEIRRRKISIAWRCETRIEDLDEDLVVRMGAAGCIGINMGIETIDETVLKNVERKRPSLDTITGIVRTCMAHDIDPFCFFVLGLPGETRETAFATIRFALQLAPTFLQFTIATPYPGTKLREWAEEKGYIETSGFAGFSSYDAVMRNDALTVDELRWLQWYAHEARELKPWQVVRRVLSSGKRALLEMQRWARFQRVRLPRT